jgi:hypothetical protein
MDSKSNPDHVQRGDAVRFAERRSVVARWAGLFVLVAACSGLAGCAAEVAPAPVAPVAYYDYPYTYYDGHIVYYVNGSWYYPYGNRWYYYRTVPPGLAHGSLHYYRRPYYRAEPYARPYAAPPAPYRRPPHGHGGGPRHR